MNTTSFKRLVWNVRGLNNQTRRNAIFQMVNVVRPSIVCLQETKMELVTTEVVAHCLGNKLESFYYLLAIGTRGGILLAWDATVVKLSNPHYTTNALTALVMHIGGLQWWMTGVYGPQHDHEKGQTKGP